MRTTDAVKYRIMTLPLVRDGSWSCDFTVPAGWELVSVLDGPLASTQRSGWDHVIVLLRPEPGAAISEGSGTETTMYWPCTNKAGG